MMKLISLAILSIFSLTVSPAFAAGDSAAGKEKSAPCQACHGPDGNSPSPAFPNLAGQYEDYLLHALRQYKSGERKNAIMGGQVAALSDADLKNLAAYYASQKGLFNTSVGSFSPDQ